MIYILETKDVGAVRILMSQLNSLQYANGILKMNVSGTKRPVMVSSQKYDDLLLNWKHSYTVASVQTDEGELFYKPEMISYLGYNRGVISVTIDGEPLAFRATEDSYNTMVDFFEACFQRTHLMWSDLS